MNNTVNLLNQYLSDLHIMYTKVHNYHWNITGASFFTLHTKLEEIYDAISEEIDEIAERILMIGGRPLASLQDYMKTAKVKEVESKDYKSNEVVVSLKEDFEYLLKLVKQIQESANENNDNGTVALLDNSVANYEKNLWMLNAFSK